MYTQISLYELLNFKYISLLHHKFPNFAKLEISRTCASFRNHNIKICCIWMYNMYNNNKIFLSMKFSPVREDKFRKSIFFATTDVV